MSSKQQNTEKKERKGPISFDITLSEEQKEAKRIVLDNDISVIRGKAGSGKTLLACQIALDLFFTKEQSKIIIARPAVTAGEDLGFLPGDKDAKLLEFMMPVLDNIHQLYGNTLAKRDKIAKHILNKDIEISSIGHLRGKTFLNAIIIVDESQNLTESQMEMVLTRLGKGSKMILTGDLRQKDITKNSGLQKLMSIIDKIPTLVLIDLKDNHRHDIIKLILDAWEITE